MNMHPLRFSFPAAGALFLSIVLVLAGCGTAANVAESHPTSAVSGSHAPVWQLDFSRLRGDDSYRVSPQQAFANVAMAEYTPDGSLHPLAAVSWLASGPGFGLAVVQLDPAGHYRDMVTLEIDPQVQSWQADTAGLPLACKQSDALPPSVPGLGVNCGIYAATSETDPVAYMIDYWTTPAAAIYAASRFDAIAQHPTGVAPIVMDGRVGWIATTGAFTSVVVPLAHGQSFVFAGTAPPARMQQLAALALEHVDSLVPLR